MTTNREVLIQCFRFLTKAQQADFVKLHGHPDKMPSEKIKKAWVDVQKTMENNEKLKN